MGDKLLIDTNLLLVMIIGAVDGGRYIGKSKRLGKYCIEDYFRLWDIVKSYKEAWITPYIAAEVSNLIDLEGEARIKAFEFARGIFNEFVQVDSAIAEDCRHAFFLDFGLTDASIIHLSRDVDILTNDQRMLTPLYATSPARIVPYIPVK